MKILISFILFVSIIGRAQTWIQITDFPATARDDGSKFTIGNTVYCGTGLQVGWTCTNDFYAFDLTNETWSTIASLPIGETRQYAVGFSVLGKGYIFGGVNDGGNYLNNLWQYNPTTNTWLAKANLPSIGRAGMVAFVINDITYITGGRTTTSNAISETWAYNSVTDTWIPVANLPINGSWRGVAFLYNNKGYVGLGRNNLGQNNKEFYEYSPIMDSWNIVSGYSHIGRAYTGFAQIGNDGYLFGGADSLGFIDNTFERVNLSNFTTQVLSAFPNTSRKGCITFAGNNSFYLTTGVSTTARFKETWKATEIVKVNELKEVDTFLMFPNPASQKLSITNKNGIIKSIKIINTLGIEVLSFNYAIEDFYISNILQKDIYIVVVENEHNKIIYRKLIVE